MTNYMYILLLMGGYSGGVGAGDQNPPPQSGKSQVAIGFLINSGTDPLEMQLDPMGQWVQLLLGRGPYRSL